MNVLLSARADSQHKSLQRKAQAKINRKLLLLQMNPLLGKKLTGEYLGFYSVKAWPYRIIYSINKQKNIVYIISITHRQAAYKH